MEDKSTPLQTQDNNRIVPVNIEEQMKTAYIDYSMSVIVGRALPDVRDGLKPVHRRILHGMNELGNNSNKPYKKAARIVGEVMGKYHPHGDASIFDTMVRMAQEWSMRYKLVDGQGNFGSQDGDGPAAMRYVEARLHRLAENMLEDIDKDTVDFQLNFDDSLKEPTVLPTRIPQLLMNGSSGIAVGMATNMMPHNLSEVIDGCMAYIDKKDITIEEGIETARQVGLIMLAKVRSATGNLDRVKRVVKVLGMVNSADGFGDQPRVMNGFSDLMVEVFGEAIGKHARSAVGMAGLPANAAVEVEMIVEVE